MNTYRSERFDNSNPVGQSTRVSVNYEEVRKDGERVSLQPLTPEQALRGLLSSKPDPKEKR